jgi:hypothetical protein
MVSGPLRAASDFPCESEVLTRSCRGGGAAIFESRYVACGTRYITQRRYGHSPLVI